MSVKCHIILFCLFYSISFTVIQAQNSYSDFTTIQKKQILNEEFNSNDNGWSEHKRIKIVDSKLTIEGSSTWGSIPTTLLPIEIDQSRNFEIEWIISYNKYINFNMYFDKILWYTGGQKKIKTSIDEITEIEDINKTIFKTKPKIIPTEVELPSTIFHKFTMRKVGSILYFFINEKLLGKSSYIFMQNPQIIFQNKWQGGENVSLLLDYVKVSYLERINEPNLPLNRTNQGSSGIEINSVKDGGKYYALIIGVSDYNDPKMKLEHPLNDAHKLKDILVSRYTFTDSTTLLVLNPTRQKLIAELFRLRKIVGPNDNLLIFYAGHGHWDEDAKQGYWWPKDATTEDPSNWLSNSDLREQIRSIKSAHTLLISDACFSGGIFKSRSGAEIMNASKDIQLLYKMPSRRAMTSGTMTTVPDKSVFLEYLCKRLSENQAKFMSSQFLFDSFRAAVINNSNVVPQDGVIAETGDEGGDFIFILKEK